MYQNLAQCQEPCHQGVPLFERMDDDNLAELRQCHRTIQEMEARCHDLERINVDLEQRLEAQAKERMAMDREIAEMNRAWNERLRASEEERDEWKTRLERERKNSEFVWEKLRWTEKELHRMLLKKYDIVQKAKQEERTAMREREQIVRDLRRQATDGGDGGGRTGGGGGDLQPYTPSSSTRSGAGLPRKPFVGNPSGGGSAAVREQCVVDTLSDFFGF